MGQQLQRTEAFEDAVLSAVKGLRHFNVLDASDIAAWVSVVSQRDVGRVLWHINRLNGVSASSVVDYVLDLRNERPDFFGRPARLADAERLMKTVPSSPTLAMKRGTLMESVVARLTLDSLKGQFSRDVEGLDKVRLQLGVRDCPSLRAEPDDILVAENGGKPWRMLAEYKCPGLDPSNDDDGLLDSGEVRLRYRCQVHAQAMVSHAARVPVQGMAIFNLVCPADISGAIVTDLEKAQEDGPEAFERAIDTAVEQLRVLGTIADGRLVRVVRQDVRFSIDLAREITMAANLADERIQAGDMAPWPTRKKTALDDATKEALEAQHLRVASAITLARAAEMKTGELKAELADMLAPYKHEIEGIRPVLPLLMVKAPSTLRTQEAMDYLAAQHVDLEPLFKAGNWDDEKVAALAQKHNVSEASLRLVSPDSKAVAKALDAIESDLSSHFRNEASLSIGLTTSKKGNAAATVQDLAGRAHIIVEQASAWTEQATHESPTPSEPEWSDELFDSGFGPG